MPSRIARNAVISLLIFALVLGITRSNLTLATAVRPYVEALLTRSTSLSEIGRALRDAASGLLSWNPWSQQVLREGEEAGDNSASHLKGTTAGTHEPPGGGADDPAERSGTADPAASSPPAPSVPANNRPGATGPLSLGAGNITPHEAGIDDQVASRGPTAARAFSVSAGRVALEPVASHEDPSGPGPSQPASTRGLGAAEPDQKAAASRTGAAGSSSSTASSARALASAGKLVAPVNGQVTYGFGYRVHPIYKRRLFHKGVDIAAPMGTPVRAAAAGMVLRAGPCGTYGRIIELDHGGGLTTLYAHCSRVLVKPGDTVRAGQKIAEVGSTGLSTGPHLHFEVSAGGKPVDPFAYLEGGRRERL